MSYSTSIAFNSVSGILSGIISGAPPVPPAFESVEPISDVVVNGYADGSTSYFAQVRSGGDGSWALPTVSLAAGSHSVVIVADYKQTAGTATITSNGPGVAPGGAVRCDQVTNDAPRS